MSYQTYPNTDYKGQGDIKSLFGAPVACQQNCDTTPGCSGFVHTKDSSRCYLKNNTVTTPSYNTNLTYYYKGVAPPGPATAPAPTPSVPTPAPTPAVIPTGVAGSASDVKWQCLQGITVPVALAPNGNVQCMSTDGKNCLWQQNADGCSSLIRSPPTQPIKPLECGDAHKQLYSVTGYENPTHWCNKAKKIFETTIPLQPAPAPTLAQAPVPTPALALAPPALAVALPVQVQAPTPTPIVPIVPVSQAQAPTPVAPTMVQAPTPIVPVAQVQTPTPVAPTPTPTPTQVPEPTPVKCEPVAPHQVKWSTKPAKAKTATSKPAQAEAEVSVEEVVTDKPAKSSWFSMPSFLSFSEQPVDVAIATLEAPLPTTGPLPKRVRRVPSESEKRSVLIFVRLAFLFGLVFFFTTVVTQSNPLEFRTRCVIALMVVIIYALVDVIRTMVLDTREFVCQNTCDKK